VGGLIVPGGEIDSPETGPVSFLSGLAPYNTINGLVAVDPVPLREDSVETGLESPGFVVDMGSEG